MADPLPSAAVRQEPHIHGPASGLTEPRRCWECSHPWHAGAAVCVECGAPPSVGAARWTRATGLDPDHPAAARRVLARVRWACVLLLVMWLGWFIPALMWVVRVNASWTVAVAIVFEFAPTIVAAIGLWPVLRSRWLRAFAVALALAAAWLAAIVMGREWFPMAEWSRALDTTMGILSETSLVILLPTGSMVLLLSVARALWTGRRWPWYAKVVAVVGVGVVAWDVVWTAAFVIANTPWIVGHAWLGTLVPTVIAGLKNLSGMPVHSSMVRPVLAVLVFGMALALDRRLR